MPRFLSKPFIFITAFCLFTNISCNKLEQLQEQVDRSVTELTSATDRLNANGANIVNILNSIKTDFPQEIHDIITNDVQNLVTTSVAATGQEFRCNVDFLRDRVKRGLSNTIIKLKNLVLLRKKASLQPIPLIQPTFCSCTPNEIDLNNDKTKSVQVYGYDFDNADSLHVYASKLDGTRMDISSWVAKPSNYNITIGVNQGASLAGYNKVEIYMSHKGLYSFLIIPKTPKICQEKDWNASPVPQTIDFMARACGGDPEFAGAVFMHCDGQLYLTPTGDAIMCKIHFTADEKDGDTHACWDQVMPIYQAEVGQKIKKILTPTTFDYTYINNHEEPDFFDGNGFVQKATFRGDHQGADVGQWTGATLQLANLRMIEVEANSDCVEKELFIGQHSNILPAQDLFNKITTKQAAILKSIDHK